MSPSSRAAPPNWPAFGGLSSLLEACSTPACLFDTQWLSIVAVNGAAVERYGYSEAEFLRLTIGDLFSQPLEYGGLGFGATVTSFFSRLHCRRRSLHDGGERAPGGSASKPESTTVTRMARRPERTFSRGHK